MTTDSRTIAAELRRRIDAGELQVGDTVPTVGHLVAKHGVATATAHRALEELAATGYVHPRSGRPAVVADRRPLRTITADVYDLAKRARPDGLTTFEQQCAAIGERARTIHHRGELTRLSPEHVSAELGTDEAIHLAGEGWSAPVGAGGEPDPVLERVVQIYDCWIHGDLARLAPQLLEERDVWIGGAWALVERGLNIPHFREWRCRVSGRAATEGESIRFGMGRPGPVSVNDITAIGPMGRPWLTSRHIALFGTVQWDFTLPIGD